MARCYFNGVSRRGNQIWGGWTDIEQSPECSVVRFCRKAFRGKWNNYWIGVVYFDDKYFRWTHDLFSEVGVRLFPKISKTPQKPDDPMLYESWRNEIWRISHEDIDKSIEMNIQPINVVVIGVRYPDGGKYKEVIKSVRKVRELPGFNEATDKLYEGDL